MSELPSFAHTLTTRRQALLGACALGLSSMTACGVGAQSTPDKPADTGAPQAASSEAPGEPTATATTWSVPDPRGLTGLSEVTDIGDIVPVTSSPSPALPVTVTDHEGNSVTVNDTSRILALDIAGTLSRTLCGLGLSGSIVGRTVSSTEPALAHLPVVTANGHDLNVEAILALSPTLILTDITVGTREIMSQFTSAGIPVVVTNPDRTLETVRSDIESVGAAVGLVQEAAQLAQRAQDEIDQAKATIAQWAPADPLKTVFLYVRGTGGVFFILGAGQPASSLITGVGASDVATEQGVAGLVPATAEAIAKLDPEVILCMTEGLSSTGGLEGLLARPGLAQTTAGKNQRVVSIPDGQSLAFGPQSGEILLSTAKALYQPVVA